MTLFLNPDKSWKKAVYEEFSIFFVGSFDRWAQICAALKDKDQIRITDILNQEKGCYAFIIMHKDIVFAAVDHVASTPIYYSNHAVSNCARTLQKEVKAFDLDKTALNEFCMTGYCTGAQTLYHGLYMVKAGEGVFISSSHKPEFLRHFLYLPQIDENLDMTNAKEALGSVLDDVFRRLVRELNGRVVLLPLSGGLDSRLVITKLLEHGHGNIISFSYGVKGNGEARIAKQIALNLGVKWLDISSDSPRILYNSQCRKDFDCFVDGLSVVPSYLDFEALYMLSMRDDIPKDAVIINGQTGDFIAGAHIPEKLMGDKATIEMAVDFIAEIHYRQSPDRKIEKNIIYNGLDSDIKNMNYIKPSAIFEFWEWQERQAKAVMVGQRSYDFFGYDWRLPLWDKGLVDFFATVPFDLKLRRKLMVEYLNDYDPKGVFTAVYPEITPWPKGRGWIKWLARGCGLIAGRGAKKACYDRFYYFSNYHNQYALFGYNSYLKHYRKTKRFVGQAALHWLRDQGIDEK